MTDRPTLKFELPATKQEVVIKEWLTGREFEETQRPIYENYKKGVDSIDLVDLNHKMIGSYVVSLGGKTENIVDAVLDLPYTDYNFIFTKINELKKKE